MSERFSESDEIKAILAHQRELFESQIESSRELLRKQGEMEGWEGFPPEISEPIKAEMEQNLAKAEEGLAKVEELERYMDQYS